MKNKVTVNHNGRSVNCWYKEMVWTILPRPEMCPLCKKQIGIGDTVYLLITNYLLFPNIVCHKSCTNGEVDKTLVHQLHKDYLRAKEAVESAKHWFPHI